MQDLRYKVERLPSRPGEPLPEDEPCFVLRGRDAFTPDIVKAYYDIAERNGAQPEFLASVDANLARIQEWQWQNAHKVKYPD